MELVDHTLEKMLAVLTLFFAIGFPITDFLGIELNWPRLH
jgi:hypothetical protein